MNDDEKERLRTCPKVSGVKAPNQMGKKWIARVISVIDGDTLNVAKCNGECLERRTVRVTCLDTGEIKHLKGGHKVSDFEQKLGARAKNTILHTMLPAHFQILDEDVYDWRKQQKIFDVEPVFVLVDCPSKDQEGKNMVADPYGRDLGAVKILNEKNEIDIANLLVDAKLADRYYGGTKLRTFMQGQPTTTGTTPKCASSAP